MEAPEALSSGLALLEVAAAAPLAAEAPGRSLPELDLDTELLATARIAGNATAHEQLCRHADNAPSKSSTQPRPLPS